MQNWSRLYSYIHDYQNLLYNFYSKHHVAFLTTYWNINKDTTIWDNEDIFGGSYERLGNLSGMKWNKYLLLPVYFPDEITTSFDGSDTGYNKEQETTIVIPSSYGITPYPGDIIKFEQQFLNPINNTYPIFIVGGIDIYPNTENRFWKMKVQVFQSEGISAIENQTENIFVFFDYDKKIYTLNESIVLIKLMEKDEELKARLKNMWDPNSGFYSI